MTHHLRLHRTVAVTQLPIRLVGGLLIILELAVIRVNQLMVLVDTPRMVINRVLQVVNTVLHTTQRVARELMVVTGREPVIDTVNSGRHRVHVLNNIRNLTRLLVHRRDKRGERRTTRDKTTSAPLDRHLVHLTREIIMQLLEPLVQLLDSNVRVTQIYIRVSVLQQCLDSVDILLQLCDRLGKLTRLRVKIHNVQIQHVHLRTELIRLRQIGVLRIITRDATLGGRLRLDITVNTIVVHKANSARNTRRQLPSLRVVRLTKCKVSSDLRSMRQQLTTMLLNSRPQTLKLATEALIGQVVVSNTLNKRVLQLAIVLQYRLLIDDHGHVRDGSVRQDETVQIVRLLPILQDERGLVRQHPQRELRQPLCGTTGAHVKRELHDLAEPRSSLLTDTRVDRRRCLLEVNDIPQLEWLVAQEVHEAHMAHKTRRVAVQREHQALHIALDRAVPRSRLFAHLRLTILVRVVTVPQAILLLRETRELIKLTRQVEPGNITGAVLRRQRRRHVLRLVDSGVRHGLGHVLQRRYLTKKPAAVAAVAPAARVATAIPAVSHKLRCGVYQR